MGVKRSHPDSVSSSEDPSTPFSREQSVDVKIVQLDAGLRDCSQPEVMRCSLPPHEPLTFSSFEEHDVHYQQVHMNRCSECHRNFPDEHFLLLHIAEYHDPILASQRDKGEKTYACLLPSCDRLCSTPQKRRLHCIDKHQFPRNYDFIIVKDGIDRRTSMLISPNRRRSSAFGSTNSVASPTGRRRGDSSASMATDMDVVRDEDGKGEQDQDEHEYPTGRKPIKLHGRGGFSQPRSYIRGGHNRGASAAAQSPDSPPGAASANQDAIDGLTSSMSALKFVPHSVRAARGKANSRGS